MPEKLFGFNPLEDYSSCPSCGFSLTEIHAKAVCERCGYKRGCCDLM